MTVLSYADWSAYLNDPQIRIIEYARGPHGLLSQARFNFRYAPRPRSKAKAIALIASEAVSAYRRGRVDLVQRKDGEEYSFLAIKRVSRRRRK